MFVFKNNYLGRAHEEKNPRFFPHGRAMQGYANASVLRTGISCLLFYPSRRVKLITRHLVILSALLLFAASSFAQSCVSGNCVTGEGSYVFGNGDKYVGMFKDGQMHGQGTYYWNAGGKYEGEFVQNRKEGQGTMFYAAGTKSSGKWQNDKLVEKVSPNGSTVAVNSGCKKGDCQNGPGIYVWPDGSKYEGEFYNTQLHGKGRYTWTNGMIYEGQWQNNKKHGEGAQIQPNGTKMEGLWNMDRFMTAKDLAPYVSPFDETVAANPPSNNNSGNTKPPTVEPEPTPEKLKGCKMGDCINGRGKMEWTNGDSYEGEFKDKKLHGFGTYNWADGSSFEGMFKMNTKHGKGKYIYPDGRIKTGNWEDGKYTGNGKPVLTDVTPVETGGKDLRAPKIVITAPAVTRGMSTVVRKKKIMVKGYATDESGVESVSVAGYQAALTKPGTKRTEFFAELSLAEGKNDFWIEAVDINSNARKIDYGLFFEDPNAKPGGADGRTTTETIATGKGKRTALIIGNSEYESAPLKNASNDADSIALKLESIGFEVMHYTNLPLEKMEEVIDEFGQLLRKKGGAGLFYFAGHGLQVDGENFLVPVGPAITREKEVRYKTVPLSYLLEELTIAENELNIVILDACRDNPYATDYRSSSKGLAGITTAPLGTFVAYATSPGMTASDGTGNNGLYTEEFLRAIKVPGLKLEEVFKRVRSNVRRSSFGEQIPWENSSIEGDFYFIK